MKNIPCPEDGDKVISVSGEEGRVSIPVQGETPQLVNYMLVGWDTVVYFDDIVLSCIVYWNPTNKTWRMEKEDEALRDSQSDRIQSGRPSRRKADYGER